MDLNKRFVPKDKSPKEIRAEKKRMKALMLKGRDAQGKYITTRGVQ